MPASNSPHSNRRRAFTPKQSFDEYRLRHGSEYRGYKSIDDPVSHKVSKRRRIQVVCGILAFVLALAMTYFIIVRV